MVIPKLILLIEINFQVSVISCQTPLRQIKSWYVQYKVQLLSWMTAHWSKKKLPIFLHKNIEKIVNNTFRSSKFKARLQSKILLCLKKNKKEIQSRSTLWSLRNFCITIFWKISVKTTSSVKSLLYNWFHEMNFKWYKNFVNSTLWCVTNESQ